MESTILGCLCSFISKMSFRYLRLDRLEQLQLEAARIVTGLTAYAETGWEKRNTRRKIRKLSLFYNTVKSDTPDYLSDLLSRTVNQTNNYKFITCV